MAMTKKDRLNRITPATWHVKLGDVMESMITMMNSIRSAMQNGIFFAPGLAIGSSSKAKVKITNTVLFTLVGVLKQINTQEVAFTATTHDIAADAENVKEACYKLSVDDAGTVTITKGTTATGAGNASVPATPAGEQSLGYVRIAVDAGATPFDATTDNLDAAHLTVTYVDEPLSFTSISAVDSLNVV